MAIQDVKGKVGYVYDDEGIQINDAGVKFANAYFNEKRAKELGLSNKEIKDIKAMLKEVDSTVLVEI